VNPAALHQLRAACEALRAEYPELADDADFMADVVEGETDAPAIVERLVIERAEAIANAEAMAKLAADYSRISERWQGRADHKRRVIGLVLDATGARKISTAAGTVSLSPVSVSLALDDGFTPPQGYARVKTEPDKAAIKAALQAGEVMPGAHLVTGKPTVRITR
jgi:hypothetical protein